MFEQFIYKQPILNILKMWLIKYKFHKNIVFIKTPNPPPPTPLSWDSLVINKQYFNIFPNSASTLSSAELSPSIGSPYSKLPQSIIDWVSY